jgi:Fungal specific transcription factor domain
LPLTISTAPATQHPEDDFSEPTVEGKIDPEDVAPSKMMPPPHYPANYHSSHENTVLTGTNSTGYASSNSPYNPSPQSSASSQSPMSIASICCPDDTDVFSPRYNYDITSRKRDRIPDPPVQPMPLVTRTPPPIAMPIMYNDFEYHTSDESAAENDSDVEELPRSTFQSSEELIRSPKRQKLNHPGHSDSHLHLPFNEIELWDFYNKVTCPVLSCKDARGENPWRDELITRAMDSDPLKHALFAMTSFHMKRYRPNEEWSRANAGLGHTNASFLALRKVLSSGQAFDDNNVAAMLVLSFSQVLAGSNVANDRCGMIQGWMDARTFKERRKSSKSCSGS